jgi:hypothetical protein
LHLRVPAEEQTHCTAHLLARSRLDCIHIALLIAISMLVLAMVLVLKLPVVRPKVMLLVHPT